MSGVEKHVDSLGRVVLPIKYRNKLGLKNHSKVLVSLDGNVILITPTEKYCALCGSSENVDEKLRLCFHCIEMIKSSD